MFRLIVVCLLASVGCGGSPAGVAATPEAGPPAEAATTAEGATTPANICDGAPALKLRVFVEPQNARELRGSIVRVENGSPSFMVDGSCTYWMSGGWVEDALSRDLGWRTGQLDASLQQELERAIPVASLGDLEDCVSNAGSFDMSTRSFRAATSRARCIQGGPRFEAAWSFIQSHSADLWAQAVPLDGRMRVEAVPPTSGDDSKTYAWPVGEQLSAFLLPQTSEANDLSFVSGVSRLITDLTASKQLRLLRDQYISDRRAAPGLFHDGQQMTDPSSTALVYLRDELPYEDSRGLLPFSDAPTGPAP